MYKKIDLTRVAYPSTLKLMGLMHQQGALVTHKVKGGDPSPY